MRDQLISCQKPGFLLILPFLLAGSLVWADTAVNGEIDAGFQKLDINAPNALFTPYGAVPNGVVIPYVSLNVASASDTVHFEGLNIQPQQSNESYDLNYNHSYKLKIDASWTELTHDYSDVAQTLYTQTSPGVLTLPPGVQSTLQTYLATKPTPSDQQYNNAYAGFMANAQNANLQTQDNKGAVSMDFRSGDHVKTSIGFSEDNVTGNKPMGASFGFNQAVQVPEPIDYKTYNFRAGTQYDTKDVQLGFNYQMSTFDNSIQTLTWANPRTATDQASVPANGSMSLAPDNWSHTLSMNGGVNLPASTRFTASETMAYMSQNENLMPYTDNSALRTSGSGPYVSSLILPEATANAEIITWTQDYALTNRTLGPLSFGLQYHSYQLDDKTPEVDFAGLPYFDSSWNTQNGGYVNSSYSSRKDTLTAKADYEVCKPLTLGIKFNVEWDHDTNRIVTDSVENGFVVDADYKPARWTTFRATYLHEHRVPQDFNYSLYLSPGSTSYAELPGLQQYDVGDRVRDQGKLLWQINRGPVTIGLDSTITHDDYQQGANQDLTGNTGSFEYNLPQTIYGLLDNRDASAGANVGWIASDRLAFDAHYDYEQDVALMQANAGSLTATPPTAQSAAYNWDLSTRDQDQVAGVGATIGGSADRVTCRLGYEVTISRESNDYMNLGSAEGSANTPPDIKYMKQDYSIRTTIKMTDHTSVVLGYLYEKYDISDWQDQNIPLISGANSSYDNYLGANLSNYVAHVGTFLVKYKF